MGEGCFPIMLLRQGLRARKSHVWGDHLAPVYATQEQEDEAAIRGSNSHPLGLRWCVCVCGNVSKKKLLSLFDYSYLYLPFLVGSFGLCVVHRAHI